MSRTAVATVLAILLLTTPAAVTGADAATEPGIELARVALPGDLPSGIVLRDVAVSDAGWVAVGYRDLGTPEPPALFSPDGSSWSVAPITACRRAACCRA